MDARRSLTEALREAIASAENAHEHRSLAHLHAARNALYETSDDSPVRVDMLCGRVFGPNGPIALTRAELALVTLLAINEHGLSREELADVLYPDADAVRGSNAVKVAIHRARRRVGVPGAICRRGARYMLDSAVDVELRRIERRCRASHGTPALDRAVREDLEALQVRLIASRPAFMLGWSWFDATERRLRDLYREVTIVLARDAMRTDRLERAIELASELTDADPLDEEAAELGIRAFLRLGDRSSALFAYQRYATHMRHELSLSPPSAISALLS
jgi:DNA-binding SARP family transcriptional activator